MNKVQIRLILLLIFYLLIGWWLFKIESFLLKILKNKDLRK